MKNEATSLAAALQWSGERRLFLGITPDATAISQLASIVPLVSAPAKPVTVSNFHLTLLFLGQSTAIQANQLCAALSNMQLSAFSVELAKWVVWPGPAVLCLAGKVVDPALKQLEQQIQRSAAASGFAPPQHSFTPHITVARHCKLLPDLPPLQLRLQPSMLTLFHSESTPQGIRYQPLWQCPLDCHTT